MDVLTQYGCHVLDIGQAVIHNQLTLGVLAEVPESLAGTVLGSEINASLKNMRVEVAAVTHNDYQSWINAQGKPRHILTLLARKIEAQHIAKVTALIAGHGLNIDKITRLSGRVALQQPADTSSKACVEFSLRGDIANETQVRSVLLELANVLDVDIAVQEDNMFRRNRRLVAFDMDSTLIEAEVIDELAKLAGVGDQVVAITESAMRGEIDFKQSFTQRVALLEGLDESALNEVASKLRLTEGAQTLVATLNQLGYKTAILSGGFDFFANRLKDQLGFDYVYANQLDIAGGKVTGKVVNTIVDGERKAELLKEIAEQEGIALEQVIAVGDGANDLPMLSLAGLGIAFRAKPLVKQSARQSISNLGLDGILYLLGISDRELIGVKRQ
jgi:phosphoserine phosphatase